MEQVTEAEQYQVFISHRGPDTKNNLASLIYHNLKPYGLRVFFDKEELRTGTTLSPAIRGAISSASVHLAIFSQNYAHSRWCLDELCWMLRSSHERTFIPIFCDVEPWELHQIERGCYADDFHKHQQNGRVSMEVVEGWKEALREAADISGLQFKSKESDYGEFLREIEKVVTKQVKWDPLEVATHPVGLDQALKDLDDHIEKQRSTKVVSIAGLSGIGKSTLAKHMFNLRRSKFSRASYLFNVSENVDLTYLQRQLFRDLLGKEMDIPNTDMGRTILRNSLKGLKFLIVLDGVDDSQKIKCLLDVNAVEAGSLIIITCCDKDMVRGSFKNTFCYEVKPLKQNHARELFCRHAFHQSNPFQGYEESVEGFLKICGGLPLCLKVFGEQLAGKLDPTYWKRQLEKFSQGQPLMEADTVINALKWSYKAMEMEQQEMLLDVGCFFVGEDVELAVRVLEGLGYHNDVRDCLQSLRQKCLLYFNNDMESQNDIEILNTGRHLRLPPVLQQGHSKIIMQNQVRELARRIAREDLHKIDKPLRLSCAIEIEKMLQLQSGSVLCRGICIREDGRGPPQFQNNINFRGVRLLVVEHPTHSSCFTCSAIHGDLVWLRWRNSDFIPLSRTISLKSLRVLELQGTTGHLLEQFFMCNDEIPSELRELSIDVRKEGPSSSSSSSAQPLDLQHPSKAFKGDISPTGQVVMPYFSRFLQWMGSLMTKMNKIALKGAIVAQSLPFDFSELKNLRHLDLSGSTNLTTLPKSFSQLLQLQHLSLRDCINLSMPVDILGEISTLEHIDFKGCAQLLHLPQGITSQRRLRYLNLLQTGLREFPFNIESLEELEQLRLGSASLTELPSSVANFVHLKELILVNCFTLQHISTPIEQLTCLETLEIYDSKVPILPAGIALLKHLKVLTIYRCPINFFSLDNNVCMDALTDLSLLHTYISSITIPAGACPRLEIVDLSYNSELRQVQVVQSTLVKLNLDCCSKLSSVTLIRLKFLSINGCGNFSLNVKDWESLEEIMAQRSRISRMRNETWSQLQRLNFFSFSKEILSSAEMRRRNIETRAVYVYAAMDFEKLLNSFHDVKVLEVPPTATPASPLLVKNVQLHSAILMCFLTVDTRLPTEFNKFKIRFEASNSSSQYEVFETGRGDGGDGLWLHMYMWTHDWKLFKDEDHLYNNVSILKEENVEGGERGWILTFSSGDHILDVCKGIMRYNVMLKKIISTTC